MRYKIMVQFEMCFTNEYVEEIVHELANIMKLVVICQEKVADEIKAVMLKWDNFIREEYGQKLTDDLHDVYGKEDTLLNSIEGFYGRTIT